MTSPTPEVEVRALAERLLERIERISTYDGYLRVDLTVPEIQIIADRLAPQAPTNLSLVDAFEMGYEWRGQLIGSNIEDSRAVGRTLGSVTFSERGLEINLKGFNSFDTGDTGIYEAKQRIHAALAAPANPHAPPPSTLSESAGASGLLPCPFCSGRGTSIQSWINKDWQTSCADCHCGTPMRFQTKELAEIAWNTRAAPVQAEPVAWLVSWQEDSGENCRDLYLAKDLAEDVAAIIKESRDTVSIITITPLYASPPTPVLGEARREIEPVLNSLMHATIDHPKTDAQSRKNLRAVFNEIIAPLYATPLSAGLDDTAPTILVKSEK